MPLYYNPLTVIKNQGAAVFCSGAKDYVTDATGVGGYLRDRAVSGSWTGLNFVHVAVPSGGSVLPTGYYTPASDHFISSGVTVIGGATPNGDIRIDPTGFIEGQYWNTGAFTDLPKNTFMSGALYVAGGNVGIGSTSSLDWFKVGVGSTDPGGSYYQGYFKTKNIHEFDLDFETDTGDLTLWTTGSGVYGGGDLTISFDITDRDGGRVSSAAEFQENPFLTEQRISILDSDGNMVYLNYRTTQDSVFTFTEQDNINVFGSLTRNFGLQIDTVNNDGTEKKSFFYLYSNPLSVEKVYIQDGEQVRLNEAFEDHGLPDTSSITSEADRIEARRYFNNQPVSGVSGSGVKDQVSFQFHFDNDPAYTDYSNARISFFAAGDGNLTYSSAGNYQTTEDFLIGSYPLEPIQGGQTFTFTKGDGVSGNRYQNIKYIIENPAGVNFESPLGTDALPVASRVKIVESLQLGIDTLFNVGNQSINGNLVVSGNESGYITGNCLTIGPPTYDHPYTIHTKDGHVGIGTSATLQAGAKLSVYGRAVGLGAGGRLTGPSDLPYLLSGDAAGGGSQNLQEVTTEGNTTNQGIEVTAGGIKVNDYITHYGDADTYAGFPSNDNFTVFTAGSSALDIDSSQQVHFPRRVGIGSTPDTSQQLLVVGNSVEVEMATSDGYSIRSAQKADISIGGTISSSGSMIAGGSGNHISGDFDTIAGGVLNNISGGNCNFVGGGSGVDITGSEFSSSIGGYDNDILKSDQSLIGGGYQNKIKEGQGGVIGGGYQNNLHTTTQSFIGGGFENTISGNYSSSAIAGGTQNQVYSTFSFIGAGGTNIIHAGQGAVIAGGVGNEISGDQSAIAGGNSNKISGWYGFAVGNKAEIPSGYNGAAVLADGQDRIHTSSGKHTITLDYASGLHVPSIGYFGQGLHVSGVPVLTGENNPAEADTLQTVTDRGNTTTTSILSTGPHISGISGLFGDRVGIGLNNPEDFNSEANRLVVGDGVGAEGLTIFSGPAHSASINFADGTGGNSSYEGFIQYRHGDEGFRIGAGGGGKMFIGANNTVGIGTLAPNAELEIAASVATIRLTDSDLTNTFSEIEKGGDYLYFYSRANSSNGGFLFAGDNGTTETEFMRIATDGDVGIGSNVPSAKLDVAGGIKLLDNNYLTWNSSNTRIVGNSDYLQFQVAASDKVRIKSDGSVGIGTTAPITRLVVDTPMNRGQTNPSGLIVTDSANGAMALEMGVDRASSASYIESRHTGSNTNYTLLLNPSYGKVGVGTSSPTSKFEVGTVAYGTNSIAKFWDGTDGVEITNRGASRQQIDFLGSNTSAINVSGSLHINYDGDNNGTNDSITFARNGVDEAGTVDMIITEGKVGIGTTDPETTLELATTMSSSPTTQLYLDVDGSNSVGGGGELIFSTSASAGAKDAFNAIVRGERSSLNDGSSDLTFLTTHVPTSATAAARMTIKDAGNVGIGTNDPDGKLHVETAVSSQTASTQADELIVENSTHGGISILTPDASRAHLYFNQGAFLRWQNSLFTIDTSNSAHHLALKAGGGNVGIGSSSPVRNLDVSTNGADTYGIRNSYNSSYYMEMAHNRFNTVGNNYIRFNIDDATKMTIVDSDFGGGVNGVGIGITNPTAELQVIGDISGSGSFLGTGVGNRITNNGVPYLLSGDSPAETQNLQNVCDNGNTTTTAVNITGAITVANHIFKNVENSFLGLYGGSDTLTNDGFIKIHGNSNNWGKVQTNIGYSSTYSKAHWTLNDTTELMTLKGDGSLGIGTSNPDHTLHVEASAGSAKITSTAGGPNLYLEGAAGNLSRIRWNSASGNFAIRDDTTASDRLMVTSDGDIVSIDNKKFKGTTYTSSYIKFSDDTTVSANSDIIFDVNGSTELMRLEEGGNVGIGTNNPTERVEVSGSLLLGPRSSSGGDTMPFLKIDGYDEHGIEMGWGTWTKWKITTKVNGQLEIYNTGVQHQSQQVSIGRQDYHKQGNLMVYSTGSVLRAGHNATSYAILDIGVQDAVGSTAYQGDAYIDVRASTSTPSRFHFKRDGEFIASGVSVSGDVLGTGVGNRITNNGTPYLLSGDSPAETQTLQDVCDNGNTTTTSIISTGPHISGVTGLYSTVKIGEDGVAGGRLITADSMIFQIDCDNNSTSSSYRFRKDSTVDAGTELMRIQEDGKVGIGVSGPESLLHVGGGDIRLDNAKSLLGETNGGGNFQMVKIDTSDNMLIGDGNFVIDINGTSERMRIDNAGNVGIGTSSISNKLDVAGSIGIGASYAGNSAPSNGAIIEGNVGIGTSSVSNNLDVAGAIAIGASFAGSSAPSNGAIIEGNVGIGTSSASNALDVNGHLSATSKSFLIDHPIEENKKLQYACLEGPENGVYVRGTTNSKSIELPEYWSELVHEDSITVVVTPIGKKQDLYIKSKTPELILIGGVEGSYDYVVYGERKDIDKLEIEPLKSVN